MTPQDVAAEIKKFLMCPDSHRIEFRQLSGPHMQDEHGNDISVPIMGEIDDTKIAANPNTAIYQLWVIEHYHIARGQIWKIQQPVSDYLAEIMTTNKNIIERNNFIKEFAHWIVTAGTRTGLTTEENHADFQAREYPPVGKAL